MAQTTEPDGSDRSAVPLLDLSLCQIQDIPLNRIQSRLQVEYVSALALKLAQHQDQSASNLAQQIVAHLNHSVAVDQSDQVSDRIWRNIAISVGNPGWIHLRLTDPGLAEWLQYLISAPLRSREPISREQKRMLNDTRISTEIGHLNQNSPQLFAVLHSHARCWAVLQMAKRENLVSLEPAEDDRGLSIVQAVSWLTAEQKLRCQQNQEWLLIGQISDALDYLAEASPHASTSNSQVALKVTIRLSEAFQAFYAACRIWGEVSRYDRPLAQVRLGLVLITQRVLRCLLEQQLNLPAPIEL